MYQVLNLYHLVKVIAINDDSTMIVGGTDDSLVIIWTLVDEDY